MAEVNYRRHLVEYFKKNIKKGYTEDALRWALVKQGYSRTTVDLAVNQAHKEMADEAPLLKEKPKITYTVVDENDNPITIKKPWWKRLFGF